VVLKVSAMNTKNQKKKVPGPKPGKKKGVSQKFPQAQVTRVVLKEPTAQKAVVAIRQKEQMKAQMKRRNLPRDSVNFFY